ncbi:MAG: phosphoethanolamine transferase, partial [Xanthomonadaceae bacterium]|nr:phosphoethanolamine transferase [Xanthomonadaceae bacterium]
MSSLVQSPPSRFRFPRLLSWLTYRPTLSSEQLILWASLFFAIFCNGPFWRQAMESNPGNTVFAFSLFLLLLSGNALLLGVILLWRPLVKPLLGIVFLTTAFAVYFMNHYGVYLDTDMVRNVLATDQKESRELLTFDTGLIVSVSLYALLPILVLWRIRLRPRSWKRGLLMRSGFILLMIIITLSSALLSFQSLSALLRNHREVRYLVTPANYLVSLAQALKTNSSHRVAEKLPLGTDAVATVRSADSKPRLLVLVVGETVRAQNWGLNGYARQTTPQLADRNDVINFSDVKACGTNTEVSLPCMFSLFGRHNYDAKKIRTHQSLLHVLEHAGITTLWRENQSGCKGVCEGLPTQKFSGNAHPQLCNGTRCFDEILIDDLMDQARAVPGDRVIVLHQLGNHGPNYFERYPLAFQRFTPTCNTGNLGNCERETIVNAYDNAVLYTDPLL